MKWAVRFMAVRNFSDPPGVTVGQVLGVPSTRGWRHRTHAEALATVKTWHSDFCVAFAAPIESRRRRGKPVPQGPHRRRR